MGAEVATCRRVQARKQQEQVTHPVREARGREGEKEKGSRRSNLLRFTSVISM